MFTRQYPVCTVYSAALADTVTTSPPRMPVGRSNAKGLSYLDAAVDFLAPRECCDNYVFARKGNSLPLSCHSKIKLSENPIA